MEGASDSGTGGSSGGSGGVAGATGGGGGTTGGSGGSGGSGNSTACATPDPSGCANKGCQSGFVCEKASCIPSTCTCGNGTWNCTEDCDGGQCVLDANGSAAAVRIGFQQGQEGTGDFCVAYSETSSGDPVWSPNGLLASAGITPAELSGMQKLTRYIGLPQAPVAFGKSYKADCSMVVASAKISVVGNKYHTVISVPFSGEPDQLWLVPDPGPSDGFGGLRIVNATALSYPIEVTIDGTKVGPFEFGNSPLSHDVTTPNSHVSQMKIETVGSLETSTVSFTGIDLLPVNATTVYVSGGASGPHTTLSCLDEAPITSGSKFSSCFLVTGTTP